MVMLSHCLNYTGHVAIDGALVFPEDPDRAPKPQRCRALARPWD
jgi:hypothetical protein